MQLQGHAFLWHLLLVLINYIIKMRNAILHLLVWQGGGEEGQKEG